MKSLDLSTGQIRRFFAVCETMLCYNIRENIVAFFTFSFVYNNEQEVKGETVMKTKEELNALKEEVEALNRKLAELTGDELKKVSSGIGDKDGARFDTRLRCTKCDARMWSSEVPDKNVCPVCGARGTLERDN